jgi:hypothetical protein
VFENTGNVYQDISNLIHLVRGLIRDDADRSVLVLKTCTLFKENI